MCLPGTLLWFRAGVAARRWTHDRSNPPALLPWRHVGVHGRRHEEAHRGHRGRRDGSETRERVIRNVTQVWVHDDQVLDLVVGEDVISVHKTCRIPQSLHLGLGWISVDARPCQGHPPWEGTPRRRPPTCGACPPGGPPERKVAAQVNVLKDVRRVPTHSTRRSRPLVMNRSSVRFRQAAHTKPRSAPPWRSRPGLCPCLGAAGGPIGGSGPSVPRKYPPGSKRFTPIQVVRHR
jgi:hypothetical protein